MSDQSISEIDAQEAISQAYFLILGRAAEWAPGFGLANAIDDIDNAQQALRMHIARIEKERDEWKRDFDELAQDHNEIVEALGGKDLLKFEPMEKIRDLIANQM